MSGGGSGEEQPFTKGIKQSNKHISMHILRIRKHDFCVGAKYKHTRGISKLKQLCMIVLWGGGHLGGTENGGGGRAHLPRRPVATPQGRKPIGKFND